MEYNQPSEIVKDLTFGDQASQKNHEWCRQTG